MFGIVLSNDLLWIFFFWELTTLFSFLLIRYTRTDEANNNAFRALILNLIGGTAFLGAIVYWGLTMGITELHDVLQTGSNIATLIPVALIAIAAMTKSAQLPVFPLAVGRDGCAYADVRAAALIHHGEGGRLSAYPNFPPADGKFGGLHGHPYGRHNIPVGIADRHFAVGRQKSTGLLYDRKPRTDRRLRGRGHARIDLGGRHADFVPRRFQVASVPVRRHGGKGVWAAATSRICTG